MTSDTVRTPGTATTLTVTIDTCGKPLVADGSDKVFVYACLRDANGTIVPITDTLVTFSVSGQGTIVGNASISANPKTSIAGIAGAILQATRTAGPITVTASATGMTSGSASTTSIPLTDLLVPVAPTAVQKSGPALQSGVVKNPFVLRETSAGMVFDIVSGDAYSMRILNSAGRILRSFTGMRTAHLLLKNGTLVKGVYFACLKSEGRTYADRFIVH